MYEIIEQSLYKRKDKTERITMLAMPRKVIVTRILVNIFSSIAPPHIFATISVRSQQTKM